MPVTPSDTTTDRDQNLRGIIDATAAAVAADAANGQVLFTTTGSGVDAVATDIRIGGHQVRVDEPPALGGGNTAPNPIETALAGLLSCQVVTYRFWAAKLGIPLDDVRVDTEGDLDIQGFLGLREGVRPGLGAVRVKVTLSGPGTPEQYRELHEQVDQHCPVLDLFANPTPVSTELVID